MKSPSIYILQQWCGVFWSPTFVSLFICFNLKPLLNLTLFSFGVCWGLGSSRKEGSLSSPAMICVSNPATGSCWTRVITYDACDSLSDFVICRAWPACFTKHSFSQNLVCLKSHFLVFNSVSVLHIDSIFVLIHISSASMLANPVVGGEGRSPPGEWHIHSETFLIGLGGRDLYSANEIIWSKCSNLVFSPWNLGSLLSSNPDRAQWKVKDTLDICGE